MTKQSMHETAPAPDICRVEALRVVLEAGGVDVVDDIDLTLREGEVVALVGESGSGKTTVGTSLLAYARSGARIDQGSVTINDHDMLGLSVNEVRELRGAQVAYVPQDPASALNPSIRIGRQVVELLKLRGRGTDSERAAWAKEALRDVGLPDSDEFLRRYPHQLSGGQVQRVALAMAFLPRPKVLVLDEPTTGLDVSTQKLVLQTMAELCRRYQVAALYVTHDLAVVSNIADRVLVMYAGQVVEAGPKDVLFTAPEHPYTQALLDAIPHIQSARALTGIPGATPGPGRRPDGCRFHDRCKYAVERCATTEPTLETRGHDHHVRCLLAGELGAWDITKGRIPDADPARSRDIALSVDSLNVFYGRKQVVFDVSFDVARGECVALVGESGSGKTTISRAVGGLHKEWMGEIRLDGQPLRAGARRRTAEQRRKVQYIFQNPYLSLNPRQSIEDIVKRPLELFGIARGRQATDRVVELLEAVALGPTVLKYRTNRLSGGERQRVAIARALAADPEILVCDEVTSALDVSVQGSIVELLESLRKERGVGILFVTHNLALVRSMAARVQVLNRGRVVESGEVAQVMDSPRGEYTRQLLSDTPAL